MAPAARAQNDNAGNFNFTYGRLEATMAMPTVAGVVSTLSLVPVTSDNGMVGQVSRRC